MTIATRIIGIALAILGALAAGMAWLCTPYSYPWADNYGLAHQLDDDGVSAILGLSFVGAVLEFAATAILLWPLRHRRVWPYGLAPGLAAVIAVACIFRLVQVSSLPGVWGS